MAERRDHDTLPKALQPFSRALAIHDALPDRFRPSDETPLRECLAGVWPTVADLRALVEWGVASPPPQPREEHPMTDIPARIMEEADGIMKDCRTVSTARVAIARALLAAEQRARKEALEEAAQVARLVTAEDACHVDGEVWIAERIHTAIRALADEKDEI